MGVSRSASTVIAYAMKEFGWTLEKAYNYVKQKRSITRPNAGFMRQLSEYEGILDARWVTMSWEEPTGKAELQEPCRPQLKVPCAAGKTEDPTCHNKTGCSQINQYFKKTWVSKEVFWSLHQ